MPIKKIEMAFRFALNYIKAKAPYDTGNLSLNAIKYKIIGNEFKIYIDENIAPYAVYTNEKWINRGGRQNPNESWWNEVVEDVIYTMALYLKGELKKV